MNSQQENQDCAHTFSKRLITLNIKVLKNYKISNIAYAIVKILQYMQLCYIVLRIQEVAIWNYSFIKYFVYIINNISFDYLIKNNPKIFQAIQYVIFFLMILIGIIMVVSLYCNIGKKTNLIIKISIKFLTYMFFLFKTILIMPILNIIIISLIPKISSELKIVLNNQAVSIVMGIIILVLFILIQMYIIYLCRQQNPYSELNHAGQIITKSILMFCLKFILVVYSLADLDGRFQSAFNITYTIMLLLLIIYNLNKAELYKNFQNNLEKFMLNFLFINAFLQTMDYYSNYQLTTLTFLVPFLVIFNLLMKWIHNKRLAQLLSLNLVLNENSQALIQLIVYLINLIDTMDNRQSKIKLQGFLNYHRRYCRIGETCHCYQLQMIKQRQEENLKSKFFKLLIDILYENKTKFSECKKLDLFLGLIYHYRIKNSLQAIYAFTKSVSNFKSTLIDKFYMAYYLEYVEQQMKQFDEKQFNKTFQINKYLQYTKKILIFEDNIESCTKNHVQFWRLILDNHPQIKRLEDLGTILTKQKDQIKQDFERIYFYNPNSIHILTVYGKFLLQVTNQESYNVKYLEKAEIILKNLKYASKVDETSSKYNQNSQTLVIVLSGNQKQLGTVVHTNNLLKNLLLYKKNEVIGKNIANIMPKFYGEHHNAVLARYIKVSESKVNGLERIVPALDKQGYICPVSALTKVLPTLDFGIQIVGFLAKLQQRLFDEDELHNISYLMYRTDTEQIVGISQRCFTDFHINPCLVYGNAYNINNELKIKDLFDISFEKTDEGKVAAALQIGQVCLNINTKRLKDDFIITNGSMKNTFQQIAQQPEERQGVSAEVIMKTVVTNYYFGVTVKLIAMYKKEEHLNLGNKSLNNSVRKSTDILIHGKNQKSKLSKGNQQNKNQTDDIKNLKDFKNFISVKRQPSAITTLSTICFLLILIICGSISGLIFNWIQFSKINQNMVNLDRITLQSQLFLPEIMAQTQKQIISLSSSAWNITSFTPYNNISQLLGNIITLSKDSLLKILPYKYSFDEKYGKMATEYKLLSNGKISTSTLLLEQVINNYLSKIQTISISNISSLHNFTANLSNNVYQKYAESKMTEMYSLRNQLNMSNIQNWSQYKTSTKSKSLIIIIVASLMMFSIVLWLICVLPYILSVTKINNRVLSLFSLIPYAEICKLIFACLNFMHKNLTEATVELEDLKYYEVEQNSGRKDMINQLGNSPTQLGLLSGQSFNQSSMLYTNEKSAFNKKNDNISYIQQKFEKMKNSEDRSKNSVIFNFTIISLLLLGFVLYYLLYSLSIIRYSQNTLLNFHYLGRRPAYIRNAKLLMFEYLLNPLYEPTSLTSIKNLNRGIITEFYNLQASLIPLDLQSYGTTYDSYNNQDICKQIPSFSSYSLFYDTFTSAQCSSVQSKILEKGLKTSIVGVLEDIRSIISQNNLTKSYPQILAKIYEYQILTKYIETPMLKVLSLVESEVIKTSENSSIIIIVTGAIFLVAILLSWRIFWTKYLQQLNLKIWRTKGLLNLIPMKIITMNDLLKNEFTSGQLEMAIR